MITDAQIHLWQNDKAPPHHWRAPFLIDNALKAMDEAGIERAVNCPAVWDGGSNDYAVEAAKKHPDRFATLGWFPLDQHACPAKVVEWMEKPGMIGLRFVLATEDLWGRFNEGQLDWLVEEADRYSLPLGFMLPASSFKRLGTLAARYPRARLIIDHLGVSPFLKLPEATSHFDEMMALACHANIAVKATGVPSMSNQKYPFADTHSHVQRAFHTFGVKRTFWGTDYTRLKCSWTECLNMFADEMPWLQDDDKEWLFGRAVSEWVNW